MSSANSLAPSFWDDVMQSFWSQVDPIIDYIVTQLTAESSVIGDRELSDDEFVPFFNDLEMRGVLPYLRVVNEDIYNEYVRRYQRVAARMMGVS